MTAPIPPERRVYCSRTLNLRGIKAVGFDMDYTLVHYDAQVWEERAYVHTKERLASRFGWPVGDLDFDVSLTALGLVFDLDEGNMVKANRFGYVKRASHGLNMLDFDSQRRTYSRVLVNEDDPRWAFVHTLFALSEGCLFAQLVDLFDSGKLEGVHSYGQLYRSVRETVDLIHLEGELKAEIMADPARFVQLDEDLPLALMDLKHAGKQLLLITNSGWTYTQAMMGYAFDPYLPDGVRWQDLFELVIVSARKPAFFSGRQPAFEVINDEGMLLPIGKSYPKSATYLGGTASMAEQYLGLRGEQMLYVGDHIFADVNASKTFSRWRTALVVRELEQELTALADFAQDQERLSAMMLEKEEREWQLSHLRLQIQRTEAAYGPQPTLPLAELKAAVETQRQELLTLDAQIAPLARRSAALSSERWGLLLRAGSDKSYLARQIERTADVYTSRVSNLLHLTPFAYLRSRRGSLPHDGPLALTGEEGR